MFPLEACSCASLFKPKIRIPLYCGTARPVRHSYFGIVSYTKQVIVRAVPYSFVAFLPIVLKTYVNSLKDDFQKKVAEWQFHGSCA